MNESMSRKYLQYDDVKDDNNNDKGDYSCNSVNFQARASRFCMKVCLDNIYNMMIMKMPIMIIMMMTMMTRLLRRTNTAANTFRNTVTNTNFGATT